MMTSFRSLLAIFPILSTTFAVSATKRQSTGNSVGLVWNNASGNDISSFLGSGSKLSWYTNQNLTAPSTAWETLDYVPMVWGGDSVNNVVNASKYWPSSVDHILSFNEPDQQSKGSYLDPGYAASLQAQWIRDLGGNYTIGAPAISQKGEEWLRIFAENCANGCKYDFVPFHYYGTNATELINYAKDFHKMLGKPLWLTEWSCTEYGTSTTCTDQDAVEEFMKTVVEWFRGDGAEIVQRWSWYGAFAGLASSGNPNGLENEDGSANSLGQYYVTL